MEFLEYEDSIRKNIQSVLKNLYGYTDDNNPFGDPNLSKPFFWVKKTQKYWSLGLDPSAINDGKTLIKNISNSKQEIDWLNKQRQERENSKISALIQSFPSNNDWREKDNSFLLKQEELRTDIRIKQGREKPIDFAIKIIKIYKGEYPIPPDFMEISTYKYPYEIFELFDITNLKTWYHDIQFHCEWNTNEIDTLYWTAMKEICELRISQTKNELLSNGEITDIIGGYNTLEELNQIENEINEKLNGEFISEEVNFWKHALDLLKVEKSKLIIHNIYNDFSAKFEKELNDVVNNKNKEMTSVDINEDGNLSPPFYESDEEMRKQAVTEHDYLFKMSENRKRWLWLKINDWRKAYWDEMNMNKNISTIKEDMNSDEEVKEYLNKIQGKANGNKVNKLEKSNYLLQRSDINNIKESRFNLEEELIGHKRGQPSSLISQSIQSQGNEIVPNEFEEIGDNEKIFNEVIPVSVSYDWMGQYKPIKPRFSNRVRWGYEWNKYNQAHYNIDSPPPKVIQGYKFNIFYPYLIDKTKTPEYSLDRADTSDMCIIKFHAGPPYEDIAFKIVNREWDMSERAGFANLFDKGILRLYFKFKRYRYKR